MRLDYAFEKRREMKFTLQISLVLIIMAIFCVNAQEKVKWKLVWKEEFNYKGLPDPKKWDYEVGHIRNKEQQYYTKARKENTWVENGVLALTGRKEIFPNASYIKGSTDWNTKDSTAAYTSASINTFGKIGWKYGRVEVKAKLPQGGGIWPAIWMMGTNRSEVHWPKCGEIDIMEYVGNAPKDIYATIHFPDVILNKHKSNGGKIVDESLKDQFHVYAMEWNEQIIDFYFDDKKYHSFSIDSAGEGPENPFRKPFYLLLNLAVGADWPGPIDDSVLPQQFLVDYVRVYQKK